jgi:hypothetical protein
MSVNLFGGSVAALRFLPSAPTTAENEATGNGQGGRQPVSCDLWVGWYRVVLLSDLQSVGTRRTRKRGRKR